MDMFTPHLTLIPQLDNTFDLRSVTLTPNSCFFAGPARRGLPHGIVVTPETEPVILELRHLNDVSCLPVVTPVEHFLPGLVLGNEVGKTQVTAFVVLDGRVLGTSTVQVDETTASATKNTGGTCFPTRNWYAWDDQMPGGTPRSLNVRGVVITPTPCYSATLEAGATTNPGRQLALFLKVEKQPGGCIQVVSEIPVSYRLEPYEGQYDSVVIHQGDCEPVVIDKIDEVS